MVDYDCELMSFFYNDTVTIWHKNGSTKGGLIDEMDGKKVYIHFPEYPSHPEVGFRSLRHQEDVQTSAVIQKSQENDQFAALLSCLDGVLKVTESKVGFPRIDATAKVVAIPCLPSLFACITNEVFTLWK